MPSATGVSISPIGNNQNRVTRYGGRAASPPTKMKDEATNKPTINIGSAGYNFDAEGPTLPFNILRDYPWTLSEHKKRNDIPYIILSEHRNTESAIMRMLKFYGGGALKGVKDFTETAGQATIGQIEKSLFNYTPDTNPKGLLQVYDDIFPDNPTHNKYIFPYFTKSYLELNTPSWTQLDSIGDALGDISGGAKDASEKFDMLKGFAKKIEIANAGIGFAGAVGTTALKFAYPLVGTIDRPRIFATHSERTIAIEFPLYNTVGPDDWEKNLVFLNIFMTQNLFNKRDYITGYPPCFYRVHVPGQYFCFASSLQSFDVQNLGNVRIMNHRGTKVSVPDAYQVKITLTEMVIPSLNQFQALFSGDANNRVSVSTRQAG